MMATRSLQRCSLIQPSEEDETFDSLAPAKGILFGILISMVFWTCLGLVISLRGSGLLRPWHVRALAKPLQTVVAKRRA